MGAEFITFDDVVNAIGYSTYYTKVQLFWLYSKLFCVFSITCALSAVRIIGRKLRYYFPVGIALHFNRYEVDFITATSHYIFSFTDSIRGDPFLLKLLQDLISVSWHVRGKYGPLGCLAQHLGTERIVGLYPTMHHTVLDMMGEQTLVPYVSCFILNSLYFAQCQVGSDINAIFQVLGVCVGVCVCVCV